MTKKGFIQFLPLFAIAIVLIGTVASLSVYQQNSQKAAVGKVLSDRSGSDDNGGDHGGSSGESGGSSQQSSGGDQKPSTSNSNKSEVKNVSEGENKVEKPEKVEIKQPEFKQEVHQETSEASGSAKFESKFENGNLKIEIKVEDGKVVTKVHDENGREVEIEASDEAKLTHEADSVLEKEDIEIATGSAEPGFVHKGEKVRTNFPLSVNPTTGQLFVTTPAGTKVVAILPAVAIENMIRAGVITTVSGGVSNPPGGTGSATQVASVLGAATELTTDGKGNLVYKISGEKSKHFLGILPVNLNVTAVVSAENGQLISTQESLFARLLDLVSF